MTDTVVSNEGSQSREFLGHPIGLVICFLTEMWERFSFYGMRTLLVLYLLKYHLFSVEKSNLIYAAYAGLVYMMPIIGGYLADRYLGSRKAVTYGAILLVAGHSLMALHGPHAERYYTIGGQDYQVVFQTEERTETFVQGGETMETTKHDQFEYLDIDGVRFEVITERNGAGEASGIRLVAPEGSGVTDRVIANADYETRIHQYSEYLNIFFLSLALIITGVGFLKANISTIVGALYGPNDPRRDGGFSIFYMGINLGSLLATFFVGLIGEKYGWNYGFGLAGIGMLFGLMVFLWGQKLLEGRADPPAPEELKQKSPIGLSIEWTIYLGGLLMVVASWLLIQYQEFVGQLLGFSGFVMLGIIIFYAFAKSEATARDKLLVAAFLIAIQSVFWALFEQQAASLTILADQQFNLNVFGFTFLASQVQLMNAGFIVLLAPVMAWLWVTLASKGLEPSTPAKFAIAMLIIGVGYIVFSWGMSLDDSTHKSFIWLVLIYLALTLGELCLSPVGLSMVTKLSVPQLVGMMMGTWFLFTALGNYVAGWISTLTGSGGHGADAGVLDVVATMEVYTNIGIIAVGVGVFILLLTPILRKRMHGVH